MPVEENLELQEEAIDQPTAGFSVDFTLCEIADIQSRIFAFSLDVALCAPLYFIMKSIIFEFSDGAAAVLVLRLLFVFSFLLYFIYMTWRNGATLGKQLVGLRVVPFQDENGNLPIQNVILRETIGRIAISFLFFTAPKIVLTDFVGKTKVVCIQIPETEV